MADQPFWASRVVALGAGPRPVPLKPLTADRLAAALRVAVDDGRHRSRATELAADLRGEHGADRVAAALERLV